MPQPEIVSVLVTAAMTVSLFGALYCFTQDHERLLFGVLGAFMSASALTEAGALAGLLFDAPAAVLAGNSMWLIGALMVAPLFWIYVSMLTSEEVALPRRAGWHFAPAGLYAFVIVLDLWGGWTGWADLGPIGTRAEISQTSLGLIVLAIPLQWAAYLVATSRRLVRYRARLKDLFASTERLELRWISVVIALYATYWASIILPAALGWGGMIEYVLSLLLMTVITLWGLRQKPGLSAPEDARKPDAKPAPKPYAKSALDKPTERRIADSLRRAMTEDKLYLNPNLSLWTLARHVRMSDNYVSQVLNTEIGENFFDFVNRHRIEDAKARLIAGNETILTITYDVGFNSRSSFYTAFNKVAGCTPSAYRKSAAKPSEPACPDDPKGDRA